MPRGTPSWASNFDRFLIDFGCQLRPPEPLKSLKFHWFYSILAFFTHFKIRTIFDPILAPTWLHFPSKNRPKIVQNRIFKGIQKMINFGIVFDAILAPTWGHLGAQVGAMLGSKTALEPPKMPPKTPLGARPRPDPQNGSKMRPPDPQNGSKMKPPDLQNELPDHPF